MRRTTVRLLALSAAALALAACSDRSVISGKIDGAADSELIIKQLDVNRFAVLDTIKTDGGGSFSYKVRVDKGNPEFIYIFKGDRRLAALLLESGEKASVEADTLGNYSVSGSEGSAKLSEIEKASTRFASEMSAASDNGPEMARIYLEHYRAGVRYVLENPYSLTVIPVLYEQMGGATPIFNQPTDAIFFRNAADSLETVYPDSRYVKALRREAERRMKLLELDGQLRAAGEISYPDLKMPDIDGGQKAISDIDARAVLVHFWDCADAAQKMMNLDVLLPIYNDFHDRGFEIYAVCLTTDKASWGAVVNAQKLPWVNVCDALGAASPAVSLYNVTSLPNSVLIVDGELATDSDIKGADDLRRVLGRTLGRR